MKKIWAGLQWLYTPVNALPVCLAAGFLMPSNAAWSTFFYIVGWPTAFLGLRRGWRPDWSNFSVVALLALWGWSSLAILWESAPHGDGYFYWFLSSASTLSLLLCFFMAVQAEPRIRERVVTVIIWCSVVAVVLSICLYAFDHKWGERLGGWGALRLQVLGATVVVVCILLTLSRLVEGKLWYFAALTPLLIYLPLNGSRMALLTLVCVVAVASTSSRKVFLYLVGFVLAVLALCGGAYCLHFGLIDNFIKTALARGTDCHVTIWRTAWELFLQRPLLGYGPSMRLSIVPNGACPTYPGPHNLYLSLLVYSGLVGFALFWLCEIAVFRGFFYISTGVQKRFGLALMLVPLIAGLTDINHVLKGPSPLWYIIWLPLLLVVNLPRSAPKSSGMFPTSSGSPPHG